MQELLTNASRHACATHVHVDLIENENGLSIMVRDDGIGFDFFAHEKTKTFGLLGIRERVLAMYGSVDFVTAPGQGTVVTINLPINGDEK